ncbi:MAG TPA: DUF1028 domain-containing protein [Planctomycetota bacterium]|nr:DUF1028 domain-containing protein [Planctomycetota bacterium]
MATRIVALALAAVLALAPPASATWSIVLVDSSTGEVGIAAATCLAGLDLEQHLPVVVVGKGGAVAQSALDSGAKNRKKIFQQLQLGTPPQQILAIALQGDLLKATRQYGIVDLSLDSVGFTGGAAGQAKLHVNGTSGTLAYAIQGNVLAGQAVVLAAETAVQAAGGTLADRLMAGMRAAFELGGDGRCSCSPSAPDSCGAPPPEFDKSAHIAFVIVARAGDTDGSCNATAGCASGDYWLDLNVQNQDQDDPDPVRQLLALYGSFVASMQGHPDGLQSSAALADPVIAGDGVATTQLRVLLRDLAGRPLQRGGATFAVEHAPGSAGLASLAGVEDHQDGSYVLTLQSGVGAGTDLLAVRVDDGAVEATLYPYPQLEHLIRPGAP